MMGHSNPLVTLKIYTLVLDDGIAKSVSALEAFIVKSALDKQADNLNTLLMAFGVRFNLIKGVGCITWLSLHQDQCAFLMFYGRKPKLRRRFNTPQ